jgi:hypothetical protein
VLSFLADAQLDLDFILLPMTVLKFGMLCLMTSVYVTTLPSSKNFCTHGLVPPATVQYVVPSNPILQIFMHVFTIARFYTGFNLTISSI